jgi:adenine-specific DNA-methyltransferase
LLHTHAAYARADAKQQDAIKLRVDQILKSKSENPSADTGALEREIDHEVYALYGLTPEEIKIVEDEPK